MRRARKPRLQPAYWIEWTPSVEAAFHPLTILTGDIPPPKRVRVYPGHRHITVIAKFSDESQVFTLKTKIPRASL